MNPGWIVVLAVAGVLGAVLLVQWRIHNRQLSERITDAAKGRGYLWLEQVGQAHARSGAQLYDQDRES